MLTNLSYSHNNSRFNFNCSFHSQFVSEPPNHNLLTVKETAEYLRIPLPTVYYLVQRGQIPAIQIGGRWRIKKSSLDKDILREDKQGQPTVLVVDDDRAILTLIGTIALAEGFDVATTIVPSRPPCRL